MKKLSRFDLGMIIAFAVVALLGGAAWWYLSGQLQAAQTDVTAAKADFDHYSVAKGEGGDTFVVSAANGKALQANIDLLTAQLDPLIQGKFLSKDSKLGSIDREDPVTWKRDLDDDVHRLTDAAKIQGVSLPPNFYFGFSRYLSQSPNDEQTAVLSKQLLGIDQITSILIKAPVKAIRAIRRTYEEDPRPAAANGSANVNFEGGSRMESDHLPGYSVDAPGGAYVDYPFEVEFDTTPENFRAVIDNLIQSPYIFVVRAITIQNSDSNSPVLADLDKLAQSPNPSMIGSPPGEVAATASTKGPQYLFGNPTLPLKIKARIDLIEWTAGSLDAPPAAAPGASLKTSPSPRATP